MSAKVLVVEDTPANMKLANLLLKHLDCQVLQAENAVDGIAMARQHDPDLILMDILLPGMDGLSATRQLKGDEATRHIKIVAFTAFAMKGDEQKMTEAGCDGYIAKPIQYRDFLEQVGKILAAPKSEKI
jgi:two-component system, cell cycle response regulator DivK